MLPPIVEKLIAWGTAVAFVLGGALGFVASQPVAGDVMDDFHRTTMILSGISIAIGILLAGFLVWHQSDSLRSRFLRRGRRSNRSEPAFDKVVKEFNAWAHARRDRPPQRNTEPTPEAMAESSASKARAMRSLREQQGPSDAVFVNRAPTTDLEFFDNQIIGYDTAMESFAPSQGTKISGNKVERSARRTPPIRSQPNPEGLTITDSVDAAVEHSVGSYPSLARFADDARKTIASDNMLRTPPVSPEPRLIAKGSFVVAYEDFTGARVTVPVDAEGVAHPRTPYEEQLLVGQHAPRLPLRVADDAIEAARQIFALTDKQPPPHPDLATNHGKPAAMNDAAWQAAAQTEQQLKATYEGCCAASVATLLDELKWLGEDDVRAHRLLQDVGTTWATLNAVAVFLTGAAVRLRRANGPAPSPSDRAFQ
jgi:hypothetical protein